MLPDVQLILHSRVHLFHLVSYLQVSGEYGLVFMLTKYGYLFLCDMETSTCLCSMRVSEDIIFTSTINTETQGFIGVTRKGQVSIVHTCVLII